MIPCDMEGGRRGGEAERAGRKRRAGVEGRSDDERRKEGGWKGGRERGGRRGLTKRK